jgi:hypothetical protein
LAAAPGKRDCHKPWITPQTLAAVAKIIEALGQAIGGRSPEELTSQFSLSQRWHVSARFLLTPYQ